jgi:glutathione S-transferase
MATDSSRVISTLLDEIDRLKAANGEEQAPEEIELWYFNGPGRGELTRLAFANGGVAFKDVRKEMADWGPLKSSPEFADTPPGKCFGSMPVIKAGDVYVAQSQATAQYAFSLGDKGRATCAQRATDSMFLGAHADAQTDMYKCLFGSDEAKAAGKEAYPAAAAKSLSALEKLVPDAGFVNGLTDPTLADLAVFDLCTSPFPGFAALGVDLSAYPKVASLVARVKASPNVAAYAEKRGF